MQTEYIDDNDEMDLSGVLAAHDKAAASALLFRPKEEGQIYLRIVPQPKGPDGKPRKFYHSFGCHFNLQTLTRNMFGPKAAKCLRLTLNQDCEGCNENTVLQAQVVLPNGQIDKDKKEEAFQTRPQNRHALNVLQVTRNNKALGEEVRIWEVSDKTLKKILAVFHMYGNVASSTDGYVIEITLEKKGFGLQVEGVQRTPVHGPIPLAEWADSRHDLQQFIEADCLTPTAMKELFHSAAPIGGAVASSASIPNQSQRTGQPTAVAGNGSQDIASPGAVSDSSRSSVEALVSRIAGTATPTLPLGGEE